MGDPEFRGGQHVSVYVARAWGDAIVATWVKPKPAGLRHPGSWRCRHWQRRKLRDVRFSNRPFRVKRFQTIHPHSVDVAHGLVLLFGIGTKALPSWGSKTRWNNLLVGLAVS